MPRGPRLISATGIYHIMFRGINRMDIFADEQDSKKFIHILQNMNEGGEYEAYAYCLMKNHIHLLMKEANDSISRSMKRIGVSYSYYYNKKYERVGHVFQDRYRSEPIENERYLLACTRYIHNNPVKAQLVKDPYDYKWSSYREYFDNSSDGPYIVNSNFILRLFSEDKKSAAKAFRDFSLAKEGKEKFIDCDDEENDIDREKNVRSKIVQILEKHDLSIDDMQNCKDKTKRYEIIRDLKKLDGISERQLSKIILIDRNIINRIK